MNGQARRTKINVISLIGADESGVKALLELIGGETAHQGNGLQGRPSDIHPRDDPHHPESPDLTTHLCPPIIGRQA